MSPSGREELPGCSGDSAGRVGNAARCSRDAPRPTMTREGPRHCRPRGEAMTTVPKHPQHITASTPAPEPDRRIRMAAAIGLAGAVLSIASWALQLPNPAPGTALWYAGNAVGEVAMVGTVVL